ncbi:MAG: hypothetical protein E7I45_07845 [Eikenella corrodens]|uniref:hypothetical protein n=1 Tax=Eikenella corrodens TaxID=539 RepID=UPI0007D05712|nr:hypothetical protein [Eikenella corrodens]MDU4300866.1 hypothetical protein [Eikenella corrodens]OAM19467.1 hypothetical protein A7P84_03945 [Eikenella corrodens]
MMQQARTAGLRWQIISILNKARPHTSSEVMLLDILRAIYADTTATELRRELDYLADRKLVDLVKQPIGMWLADLTRLGVDIAEYTIDCQPGIARPDKYWEG